MDNKATTKRMIGAVVLVLVAALLLAWLLKGKNREGQEMAMNQTAETKPILGFPGVNDPNAMGQKPSLIGEDPNTAQNLAAQGQTTAPATGSNSGIGALDPSSATNLIPNVGTVPNTTGFDVRPAASGETRQVVDTDGKVKSVNGSIGTGDAKATTSSSSSSSSTVSAEGSQAKAGSASKADTASTAKETATVTEKKPTAKPVLVGEKAVTGATVEAKAKEEAERKAAEKAAAAKSLELSKASTATAGTAVKTTDEKKPATTPATPAAAGGFVIQLAATADKAKADELIHTFTAEGYKPTMNVAKVDGKTVYRVVIGGYADKVAATAAQAKMKARYTQNRDVQNSFITSSK